MPSAHHRTLYACAAHHTKYAIKMLKKGKTSGSCISQWELHAKNWQTTERKFSEWIPSTEKTNPQRTVSIEYINNQCMFNQRNVINPFFFVAYIQCEQRAHFAFVDPTTVRHCGPSLSVASISKTIIHLFFSYWNLLFLLQKLFCNAVGLSVFFISVRLCIT